MTLDEFETWMIKFKTDVTAEFEYMKEDHPAKNMGLEELITRFDRMNSHHTESYKEGRKWWCKVITNKIQLVDSVEDRAFLTVKYSEYL